MRRWLLRAAAAGALAYIVWAYVVVCDKLWELLREDCYDYPEMLRS